MKKEVLITGGAGYIGPTLIPELLVKGYHVTVYDSLTYEGDILIPYFANWTFKPSRSNWNYGSVTKWFC